MRVVVDVNFPLSLARALSAAGIESTHWTAVGRATAPDAEVLAWAHREGCVVLTQDLDYGDILAVTGARAPSVLLVRQADALGAALAPAIIAAFSQCGDALRAGAIVVLDVGGRRVRTLPIE